jgi:hypothetical protein
LFKGIVSNVTLNGAVLTKWKICLTQKFIPNYKKDVTKSSNDFIHKIKQNGRIIDSNLAASVDFKVPAIYIAEFFVPSSAQTNGMAPDTFLNMEKFTKVHKYNIF